MNWLNFQVETGYNFCLCKNFIKNLAIIVNIKNVMSIEQFIFIKYKWRYQSGITKINIII